MEIKEKLLKNYRHFLIVKGEDMDAVKYESKLRCFVRSYGHFWNIFRTVIAIFIINAVFKSKKAELLTHFIVDKQI